MSLSVQIYSFFLNEMNRFFFSFVFFSADFNYCLDLVFLFSFQTSEQPNANLYSAQLDRLFIYVDEREEKKHNKM